MIGRYLAYIECHRRQIGIAIIFVAWLIVVLNIKQVFNHEDYPWAYTWPPLLKGIMASALVSAVVLWPRLKFNLTIALFCLISFISVVINSSEGNNIPYYRWGLLVLMLSLLSPLIRNSFLCELRKRMWQAVIVCLRVLVIAVFILFYISYEAEGSSVRGAFKGPLAYAMMMGPLAAFVTVDSAYRVICRDLTRKMTALYCCLFVAASLEMIAAGSRSAMLAAVCGIIVIFVVRYRSWKRIVIVMSIAAVICSAMVLLQPRSVYAVNLKNRIARERGSVTLSRDRLWHIRLDEFKESPVIGIGFRTPDVDHSAGNNGFVLNPAEPGSSWLSVLSNTGIIGLVVLLGFNAGLTVRSVRKILSGNSQAVLLLSLLVFYAVHGFFEGWMLYGGSLTFFIYWLLTSRICNLKNSDDEDIAYSCRIYE